MKTQANSDEQSAIPGEIREARTVPRILVAEDNVVNQRIAKQFLVRGGYEVVCVESGVAVMDALHEASFELVLMDWHMPLMDGLEATRAIRASGQTWSNMPVIALTANAMESDRTTCLHAGMDDYISKPFMMAQFLETVAKWVRPEKAA